jgi:flagellar basal body-associated protein FliL
VRPQREQRNGGEIVATWLWVLIIVLVVLALFGGVGYRRW